MPLVDSFHSQNVACVGTEQSDYCMRCHFCYRCFNCYDCENCSECTNCNFCINCHGLGNACFYINNKKVDANTFFASTLFSIDSHFLRERAKKCFDRKFSAHNYFILSREIFERYIETYLQEIRNEEKKIFVISPKRTCNSIYLLQSYNNEPFSASKTISFMDFRKKGIATLPYRGSPFFISRYLKHRPAITVYQFCTNSVYNSKKKS